MLLSIVNFSTLVSVQSVVQKLNQNGIILEVYKKNAFDKAAMLSNLQQFFA